MALQNRVTPLGQLEAVSAKGAWLGNRGILHDDQKRIAAPWRHKAWVTCQLEFKGRKREIFGEGTYSELFFLDEATALAAGHRPCGECRRARFNEFKLLWSQANDGMVSPKIADIDKLLHAERAIKTGDKLTYEALMSDVPSGAMVAVEGEPYLIWHDKMYHWSHQGYDEPIKLPPASVEVTVITPRSIVKLFEIGFVPQVHDSANIA
ncbi:hypothetical protein [uncultured Zhongshania sp.]|jgi:hypothetical protein|uniref:hypothetical protein n=1 Tax=uncultured Zhongshania sp. TaxID=1642288 RepID=UPI0025DF32AD|nr:hypothetical protein [uncultured Zhongshania sp.]